MPFQPPSPAPPSPPLPAPLRSSPGPQPRAGAGPRRLLLLAVTLVVTVLAGCPRALAAGAEPPDPVGTWPLSPQPKVVRGFDPPDAPWGAGHRGVDLAGRPGQPILAALPGRISFAGMIAGRGTVVVDHGATRTTYEPVLETGSVGDVVAMGDRLGVLTLAQSHCAPAACLHWGWIRNVDDVYLDPLALVGGGPIRLLPLWRDDPVATPGSTSTSPSDHPGQRPPYAGWPLLLRLLHPTSGWP